LLGDRQVGQRTALVGLSGEKWVICVQIAMGIGLVWTRECPV